jgi:malate dehydrogenase
MQAYAGAQFTNSLLRALGGEAGIVECTFVENSLTVAPFFSTRVQLGTDGVERVLPFGNISAFEKATLDEMLPTLIEQVRPVHLRGVPTYWFAG